MMQKNRPRDIIADNADTFLGSRMKRLADRMMADAGRIAEAAGLPVQPAHMSVLGTIGQGPISVGDLASALGISQPGVTRSVNRLVELGLVATSRQDFDRRLTTLTLTEAGAAVLARARAIVWAPIGAAVREMTGDLAGPLAAQLTALEQRLDAESLWQRSQRARPGGLALREWDDSLAGAFRDINAEWISTMFSLEANDRAILDDPRGSILADGGVILFVEADGLGTVGTCALKRMGDGVYELTKMGVLASARGRGAGEFLLAHTLARASSMAMLRLYLLTNCKCAAAIHLYEKMGFRHDARVMADYGARYARCDVAMSFPIG